MPTPTGRSHAVLHPSRARQRIEVGRSGPDAGLADLVDYFWWVRWDVPEPHEQEVVPRPVVHVSAEVLADGPRLVVTGVHQRMFSRRLVGQGHTVAAGFRPAGFRPLLRGDVGALQDREVRAVEVLGVDDRPVAEEVLACERPEDGAEVLGRWLAALPREDDPLVGRLADLVERAEQDPALVRAGQLADLAGVSLRTLQRWFRSHVGIGPKWVVQRFRLLDAVAAAHGEDDVDWAGLAARLGYADQSHLVRAFTQLVGHPPAAYAREA
ncbi:helix-turn-helix domain-containing protein [Nocardioides okcheonensis]|uniref:helix-turn-helix domain-containing protein n=1 Tax=Nocardioides okcheonensis TaxID=2894081 RepID=UPI001E5C2682|nr:helix-turn-helix domain-containing protein [Nocardioides okcheonensis]UFN44471.1 helix-turn-helix domain-containing protein [Nocardioides okcheonensis]